MKTRLLIAVAFVLLALTLISLASAAPNGVSVTHVQNETNTPATADLFNTSGGSITTLILNGTTQNYRWKAYVGNVSGSLVLDDADGSTVYDWDIDDIYVTGEVYATRSAAAIDWPNIQCATTAQIEEENGNMSQTSPIDNITATFYQSDHREMYVGTVQIASDSCSSLRTYVNDTAQSSIYDEIVLIDAAGLEAGDIVYATIIEQNEYGFNNETYDFQMIVPENGQEGFSGSTSYFFYAELT